uniref:Ovule protein n=1 Tax=Ascaris lumbricoides TaxID=6252 RepID=A0A0M3II78_ASCLU
MQKESIKINPPYGWWRSDTHIKSKPIEANMTEKSGRLLHATVERRCSRKCLVSSPNKMQTEVLTISLLFSQSAMCLNFN